MLCVVLRPNGCFRLSQINEWILVWDGDGIYCGYWCRHRSKDCSKAHHLPSRAFTFWVGRVIPKNNLHHDHVCTDEFTQTGATRLLYSDLKRKMPKSTERGSHSNPLKEEATPVHKRRKLLESTEGSSCTSPGGGNHLILLVWKKEKTVSPEANL